MTYQIVALDDYKTNTSTDDKLSTTNGRLKPCQNRFLHLVTLCIQIGFVIGKTSDMV